MLRRKILRDIACKQNKTQTEKTVLPFFTQMHQRVRFCLPCQMKCIPTLTLEVLSIFSRRHFRFLFLLIFLHKLSVA